MLFRLSDNKEYSYVADDFSILSKDGESFYTGRAISTKPYHLSNFPHLKKLIDEEMPPMQKLQWNILKDNRLVFGINPATLFSGRIRDGIDLKTVIHLVNTNKSDFVLEEKDPELLSKASVNIIMNEMILGNQIIYKLLSIPGNDLLPSPGEIFRISYDIYKTVFKKTTSHVLQVPYRSHPDKMYDFLVENGILS